MARSDYGHLRPVLAEIQRSPHLDLALIVGGAHLSPRYGGTVALIEEDGWPIAARVAMVSDTDTPEAIARALGAGVA